MLVDLNERSDIYTPGTEQTSSSLTTNQWYEYQGRYRYSESAHHYQVCPYLPTTFKHFPGHWGQFSGIFKSFPG